MGEANPIVLVIDDDPEFRDSIVRLLRDGRTRTRQFSSVFDFLKADPSVGPTCLVLDVRLPGRSGLELSWPRQTGNSRSSSSPRMPTCR